MLVAVFGKYFPTALDAKDYCNKPGVYTDCQNRRDSLVAADLFTKCDATGRKCRQGDVQYMFVTKPGQGPVAQPLEESLIDLSTGGYRAPSDKHKRLSIGAKPAASASSACATSTSTTCCQLAKKGCSTSSGACCGGPGAKIALLVGVAAALGYLLARKSCCSK